MSEFHYNSDDFDRQAQRFVVPLYTKDELGNYYYDSTGTLVQRNGIHFVIFAAHALVFNRCTINDIYFLFADGTFVPILQYARGYKVLIDEDIVIVDWFNTRLESKNYFNLDKKFSFLGIYRDRFKWIGFPVSKTKTKGIHNSKSKESICSENTTTLESGKYFTKQSYFQILSPLLAFNDKYIKGIYEAKNVRLKYNQNTTTGPAINGMSGGAMYFFSFHQIVYPNLENSFVFAGIGLEHIQKKEIVGISRFKVINLIDNYLDENPLTFNLMFP